MIGMIGSALVLIALGTFATFLFLLMVALVEPALGRSPIPRPKAFLLYPLGMLLGVLLLAAGLVLGFIGGSQGLQPS